MGLLRKASGAPAPGEAPGEDAAAVRPGTPPPRARSLLHRSLAALSDREPAAVVAEETLASASPAPGETPAPAAPAGPALAVDLDEGSGAELVPDVEIVPEDDIVHAEAASTPAVDAKAPAVDQPPPAPPRDLPAELRAAVGSLRDGVELPSRLFSAAAQVLGIRKGALLLFDAPRMVYAPWASVGWDQTTLHRMRVPLGATESFNTLANGAPVLVSGAESLAPYKPYFSSREFAFLERLWLTPFIAGEKLVAVCLVSDVAPPAPSDDELAAALAALVRAGAPRVEAARAQRIEAGGGATPPSPAGPEEALERFLAAGTAGEAAPVFVSLSLEDYARRIMAAHEHLDRFRLHEDIQHFLATFVADVGIAVPLRPGLSLVGLRALAPGDVDLFVHQLTVFLDVLFQGGDSAADSPGPRVLATRQWPPGGAGARALLQALAS